MRELACAAYIHRYVRVCVLLTMIGCMCVCVCETKGVERISSTLVSFPPRALCCLWWLPCRESGEGGRTLPLHLSFHLGLTSSRLFLLHSLHTRHLPPSLPLCLFFSCLCSLVTSSSLRTGWSSMPGKRTLMAYVR